MHATSRRRRPDDGTAALSAANAVSVVRHPRMPYAILAGMQAACAVVALALSRLSEDPLGTFDEVAAVAMAALALFSWFVAPRTRYAWGLGFSLFVVETIAVVGALLVVGAEGQALVGLGLVLFGAFAGYFRPKPFLWPHLALLTGGYAVAYVVNPRLSGPVQLAVVVGIVAAVTLMVSSLADHLRELALRDPLTGVLNRRGLDMLAPRLAAAAARSDQTVTVGVVDLDEFKLVNTTLGHLGADQMLVKVADAWGATKRASDVVARLGGDEFVVVLTGSTPEAAEELAARARKLSSTPWTAGFAVWDHDEPIEDAVARADAAMLARKRP